MVFSRPYTHDSQSLISPPQSYTNVVNRYPMMFSSTYAFGNEMPQVKVADPFA